MNLSMRSKVEAPNEQAPLLLEGGGTVPVTVAVISR